jgi:glycosyltransferase involved in cell wall biosynthesis
LFQLIHEQLAEHREIDITASTVPHPTRGIFSMLRNILYTRRFRDRINHISGDVHYVTLALDPSRTILTIHDCVAIERNRSNPLRFHFFKLFWLTLPLKRARMITTVSQKTKDEIRRYAGKLADRITVVGNFVDPRFSRVDRPFNAQRPTILQIGTTVNKNLERLIEALDGLPCRLVVIGKLSPSIEAAIRKHGVECEHFHHVPFEDVKRAYEEADIISFASLYEGFGLPILEGNAVGRPVVTSNCSPMNEVAADAACLVDPMDAKSIRAGIERIIHDPAYREELVRRGFENVKRYSIETVADQYLQLYKQIAGNGAAKA